MKKFVALLLACCLSGCVTVRNLQDPVEPDDLKIEAVEDSLVGDFVLVYLDCLNNCIAGTELTVDACRQRCVEFMEVLRKKL